MRRLIAGILLLAPTLASSQSKGEMPATSRIGADGGPGPATLDASGKYVAQPKVGDLVNNPPYSHWAQFRQGSFVTVKEVTTLADGSIGQAVITSRLLSKTKDKIRVEILVSAGGVGSWASVSESTRTISEYPAKVRFEDSQTPDAAGYTVTEGKELIEHKGKQVETEWIESSVTHGDETTVEKLWTVQRIPGGILKRTVEKRRGNQVVSAVTHVVEYSAK